MKVISKYLHSLIPFYYISIEIDIGTIVDNAFMLVANKFYPILIPSICAIITKSVAPSRSRGSRLFYLL